MHLILGGPGSGKTRTAMEIVSRYLAGGTRPDRIAFVSFTKKAVREAQRRAAAEFNLSRDDLPYFRTLHSLAYAACGVTSDEVFGAKGTSHWAELAHATCCTFTPSMECPWDGTLGDRGVFLDGYARTTKRRLYDVWCELGDGVQWNWLRWFAETLRRYKQENLLLDYTGMIERYLGEGAVLALDVAIVDEAQDLSRLQWEMVRRAFADVPHLYILADDDQAIFAWSGADVEGFLGLQHDTQTVLPRSYRLCPEVFDYAQGTIQLVRRRYPKPIEPVGERRGRVYFHRYLESVPVETNGSWLLLSRNKRFLEGWTRLARTRGVLYATREGSAVDKRHVRGILDFERLRKGEALDGQCANAVLRTAGRKARFTDDAMVRFVDLELPNCVWHEVLAAVPREQREYYVAMLRRRTDVRAKPSTLIETIHAVKGGEADHVALVSDVTRKTYKNLRRNPDDERRTWYVGMTRTRGDLHVVLPQTHRGYPV